MGFLRHLLAVIGFLSLPREERRLVFYAEGKNYWPHLEGMIRHLLASSDIPLCYISSGADDPGLSLRAANYRSFRTDEGFVRNWLFENMQAEVMVMTMPDLHNFQVKRSKHKVHYVYVQHSLVSLHMIYKQGAFDHYDTIFCAGPHHVREIRALEARYGLPQKRLLEHGYGRLDAIIAEAGTRRPRQKPADAPVHVLIAPSWGPQCTIESGTALRIIAQLIEQGCEVTLRPHPQTIRHAADRLEAILYRYSNHPRFHYEATVAGQESLHESDVMISDWSGAALDYAFGLKKPVLFVDVPRKVNNPDYEATGIVPFEVTCRSGVGQVLEERDGEFAFVFAHEIDIRPSDHVFQVGNSARTGAQYLQDLLNEVD